MFKHLANKKGFTLIELMMVVVVIGILVIVMVINNVTADPYSAVVYIDDDDKDNIEDKLRNSVVAYWYQPIQQIVI